MPGTKRYAISSFEGQDALYLDVNGVRYPIVQFSSSFARNEIPQAQCLLSVGRDIRTFGAAAAHGGVLPGTPVATVWFTPTGDRGAEGAKWSGRPIAIFRGRVVGGLRPRKSGGRVTVSVTLVHWLIDLASASAVAANGPVANPAAFNGSALVTVGRGTTERTPLVAQTVLGQSIENADVADDVWGAVKAFFEKVAGLDGESLDSDAGCARIFANNPDALAALARFEGPGTYNVARPLALNAESRTLAGDAIARVLSEYTVADLAGMTFWDVLVGRICPLLGLAVIPTVESAYVVADMPYLRGGDEGVWRTLNPDQYDGEDYAPDGGRPLKAVGVVAEVRASTLAEDAPPGVGVGGCFIAIEGEGPAAGDVRYVNAPAWLSAAAGQNGYAGVTTGTATRTPAKVAGSAAAGGAAGVVGDGVSLYRDDLRTLFDAVARDAYLHHTLSARVGQLSGPLRFDIAPGSVVQVDGSSEDVTRPAGFFDALQVSRIACVDRVTTTLSGEGPVASTVFDLSFVRSLDENALDRYSNTLHPLFGAAAHSNGLGGAPLIPLPG